MELKNLRFLGFFSNVLACFDFAFKQSLRLILSSLPPISVELKNPNDGFTAFSFASNSTDPFFSFRPSHLILSACRLLPFLPLLSALCIQMFNRLFRLPTPPIFRGFYYPYPHRKDSNSAVPYFELEIPSCVSLLYFQPVYASLPLTAGYRIPVD